MTNINYQTSHLTAFISAALVHSLVAAWAIFPSSPIVINQQAIRVSFVAPSSSDKKSFEASHKKIAINTDRENALKQKQDNKVEKSESETKKKIS